MNPRKRKAKLIDKASDAFLSRVKTIERRVWKFIREFVDGLNRTSGKIDYDAFNEFQLLSLDQNLINVYTGGFDDYLPDYLTNFDQVAELNRLMYGGFLSTAEAARVTRLVFPVERTILVDEVVSGLTSPGVVRDRFVKPIRSLLYNGIVFNQPVKQLQDLLREEILGAQGSSSKLLKYTRQISQDAISQFDGAINDRIRDELDLDGFYYVGSVIKTTRPNCNELVSGSGRFANLAIKPGLYATKDLGEIVERGRGRSGWNPNTTAQNFAQYRGGYGCRHEVIYVHLDEKDQIEDAESLFD